MSNRHVKELSKVWQCLLKDAAHAYPALEMEFERDLNRLERVVKARGIRVFLVDLPAIGKHLDRCLAEGQYNLPELPLTQRVSRRVQTPKFLRGIHLLVFDELGRLKDDADGLAVFFYRQLTLFAKKADIDCPASCVEDAVLDLEAHNASLPIPGEEWANTDCDFSEVASFSASDAFDCSTASREALCVFSMLDMVSNIVSASFGPYSPQEWRFKHGPGAVSERSGRFDKYKWSNWSDDLEKTFPVADYGYCSYSAWGSDVSTRRISGEIPRSRLVAVPKSFTGPRLIAAEPSEHMWCQQNLLSYMLSGVTSSWLGSVIKFDDQTQNQKRCLEGSRDGTVATIDLSMASDCVTPAAVGALFRANPSVLRALRACRTQELGQQLTMKVSPSLRLRMFSTMGSAVTFPVESILFAVIGLSTLLVNRGLRPTKANLLLVARDVSVFGDDIIIPKESRKLFVEALELLRFKVNTTKSFWSGNFRESCGVDAFRGVNVTPLYWRRFYDGKPQSLLSVLDLRNRCYKKYLMNTSRYLESTLPWRKLLHIGEGSGVLGLLDRVSLDNDHLRVRYNSELQRHEVRGLQVSSCNKWTQTEGDSALHQWFTDNPGPFNKWKPGYSQRAREVTRWAWVGLDSVVAQATCRVPFVS